MGDNLERLRLHQRLKIHPQLSFRWLHGLQGTELFDQRLQSGSIRALGYYMANRNPPLGLFQSKMPEVGEDNGQLLFVIRPPGSLPGVLHEYNPQGF
jgi:hypothetical protein